MNKSFRLSLVAAALGLPAFAASAGQAAQLQQRDVQQEQRIANGLRNETLTAREAGQLQRSASHIDYLQSRALADGRISNQEANRIDHAQDVQGRMITQQMHDRQYGNAYSQQSRIMLTDARRDVEQEQRILDGQRDGSLTAREASRLEYGQAATSWHAAQAQATGGVNPWEQQWLRRDDAYNSAAIRDQRHDGDARNVRYAGSPWSWWGW
ncbi:MAG TPA: hypothetical protein VJM11_03040 [Nevskiaceae bacterium]|nr:hypothetical protein [Nevskiaceae bacterium]